MITISYSLASLTEDFSWIPPVIIVTKVIIARKTIAPVYTAQYPAPWLWLRSQINLHVLYGLLFETDTRASSAFDPRRLDLFFISGLWSSVMAEAVEKIVRMVHRMLSFIFDCNVTMFVLIVLWCVVRWVVIIWIIWRVIWILILNVAWVWRARHLEVDYLASQDFTSQELPRD